MVVPLDFDGLIREGVHDATVEEVEASFGRSMASDRRSRLLQNLKEYISELKSSGWSFALIINGSFAMACVDEPNDIDLILVLPPDWDLAADLKPADYALVSRHQVFARFQIEVFPVREHSLELANWTEFFSQVNVKWCQRFGWSLQMKKGLVRVIA